MLAPVTVLLMLVAAAAAQQQITPPAPIQVSTTIVTISNSAGKQTDAHVDKDLTAYVNLPDNKIHYYRFSAGVDTAIPLGTAVDDQLPDIGGNRICFTRQGSTGNFDIAVFDVLSSTTSLVDPHPGDLRLGCALGGDTLVFVDFDTGEERGDIFFYDLSANPPAPPQALSLDSAPEQNPNVSSDGNTVVWENCPIPSNCDIWKSVRSGGVWATSVVTNSTFNEENPDTDGTWITYDAGLGSPTGEDIFFLPAVGGQTTQLAIPGTQVNPSISHGFIAFESTIPLSPSPDIYVYDIAMNILYQVTSTPGVNEELNAISVLDNGDVRVVWAADDGPLAELNIYGTTFTPISNQVSYHICPLYDQNVAKKSGSAYPIKLQLCDASGNNLSSSSVLVHAVSVARISSNTPTVLDDTGNANPDFDFRYDASLAGYIFNLSTKGYTTGTYSLNFIAGSDPAQHSALFAVK
jgi:hypothetical protein